MVRFIYSMLVCGFMLFALSGSAEEVYYDQFNWGTSGNPGGLNTSFWGGTRFDFSHEPFLAFPPTRGALRLTRGGSGLALVDSRSLISDFPTRDYEFYARLIVSSFEDTPGERNAEIAFRSNGSTGYMLTFDGGNNQIRFRRQGGGFGDLLPPLDLEILPGDEFYLRASVQGTTETLISIDVATTDDLTSPIFSVNYVETDWLPSGNFLSFIAFTEGGGYAFDLDYFAIGQIGFDHPPSAWLRDYFTNSGPPPETNFVTDLDSYDAFTTGVVLHSGDIRMAIAPQLEGTVRVDFSPDGSLTGYSPWTVTDNFDGLTTYTITDGDPVMIHGEGWRVDVSRSPMRLTFRRPDGSLVLKENAAIPLTSVLDQRLMAFDVETSEAIYGLGQHSIYTGPHLNRMGRAYEIDNVHQPPSRLLFPYWVSRRNYGVFIDNPGIARLDFGMSDPDLITYSSQAGELRYYVMLGDSMYDVMDKYTQLTGRPALAPRWTLGNLQSRFGYQSWDEIQGIIEGFRTRNIPLDCIIIDLYWFGIETMGNLEFQQTNAWANPAERIQGIQDQGIKLIPITEPMMTSLSFNASEVLDQGLVGVRPDGTTPYQVPNLTWITSAPVYLLDFTKAEMRAWWIEKHQKLIQDYGFDGFWQDLNEPEAQPLDMVYDGGTAVEVHNVIGQQMNRALDEAMQVYRPGGRTFIMSRSGFPGMQRYGAGVWSGDVFAGWNDLAGQVPLAASMGLAGVPYWNSDIGGFTGFLSPELYLRWCQFGFFNPIYRPHASNAPREPWAFGQDVEDAVADLLRLRYRLIPHYYTVAREAYDSGAPIMRPLVMDYPGDLNVENLTTQFLYGDYLMAAPITQEGATSKEIYLPDATWYDWFRHTRYDGAQTLQYAVDSDDFPLLVRAPAIIPLGPVMETSDEAPLTTVALRVYLPTDVSATSGYLYEDDGLTTGYRVGEFATTQFTATRTTETQVTVTVTPAAGDFTGQVTERVWQVELYDSDEVLVVQANDNSLEMQPDLTTLNNSTSGWFYDSANRITHAKLSISSTSTTQTINFFEEIPADDSTNYIKLF